MTRNLARNIDAIRTNTYPGRGFIIGKDRDGNMIIVYFLTGRSTGSQNRILIEEDGIIRTKVADPSLEKGDPALTIYEAILPRAEGFEQTVGNGSQVLSVSTEMDQDADISFAYALEQHTYEPDAPNYTPRITGNCGFDTEDDEPGHFQIVVHRRPEWATTESGDSEEVPSDFLHYWYEDMPKGLGRYISTYAGDAPAGKTLPPFEGEPLLVPLEGTIDEIAQRYWDLLPTDKRVSIAVRSVNKAGEARTRIINTHEVTS
jgi:IMP cyclohydrolase